MKRRDGGGGVILAMLMGWMWGHNKFSGSFNMGACSLRHTERGGGREKFPPS